MSVRQLLGPLLALVVIVAAAASSPLRVPQSVEQERIDSLLTWRRAGFPLCADGSANCEMFEVALTELITRPEVWNNRRVAVRGHLHLEFEGNALYASNAPRRYSEAVWFDTRGVSEDLQRELNNRDVRVIGTFRAAKRGHMGLFAGTLEQIGRVH